MVSLVKPLTLSRSTNFFLYSLTIDGSVVSPILHSPHICNVNIRNLRHDKFLSLNERSIHTYRIVYAEPKPSSKIGETVNRLKEKTDILEDVPKSTPPPKQQVDFVETFDERRVTQSTESKKPVNQKDNIPDPSKSINSVILKQSDKTLWMKIRDEIRHYVSGFKLLYIDVKVSTGILRKVARGTTLTRRENKQLVRTVSDLFRLVPFSVFLIVPFMEFLLPVALKLFPGMLPSTFSTKSDREQKMRRSLKAKLEYAKFLQKTLDEMALKSKGTTRSSNSAKDFVLFYQEVKEKGIEVKNEDILKFSKLFEDEITLDNMTRRQLIALCQLLELMPLGANTFLRMQLEFKLQKLKEDDKVIHKEGIEHLNVQELQNACKERGMRALGLSRDALMEQLSKWLDLSLNHSVPPSLLLLSRTLYLPDNIDPTAQIAATISSLPEHAATQTSANIGELEGKIKNVVQLEVTLEEQRKIEEEEVDRKRLEVEKEELKAEEAIIVDKMEETAESAHVIFDKAETIKDSAYILTTDDIKYTDNDKIDDNVDTEEKIAATKSGESDDSLTDISPDDMNKLKTAIEALSNSQTTESEKSEEEISNLKKELKDYEKDLNELKDVRQKGTRPDLEESVGAKLLRNKFSKMMSKLDGLSATLKHEESELEAKIENLEESETEYKKHYEKLITVQELIDAFSNIPDDDHPNDAKIEQIAMILQKVDEDGDGIVNVDHLSKVVDVLSQESIKLNKKQLEKLVDLLQVDSTTTKVDHDEILMTDKTIENVFESSFEADNETVGKDEKK